MKHVILKRLTLVNFRGEKVRTTNFNADVTTISGGNGLGKSRHFDAFVWLLFGKDAQDRKDYEIKTRVNGQELHDVECSVAGTLAVDGEEVTLKRAFIEDWVKPRGQVERVLKGNHTECWWNETPVNVGEYAKRIEAIIDASLFKMITNPAFFAGMNWKLQREQLFQIAGAISDEEIAARRPEFAALLDKISGRSLEDFKREVSARKKRLKNDLEQVSPRIDQTQKMRPVEDDFSGIEKQIGEIDRQVAEIDREMTDLNAALEKEYETEQARQRKINALKTELSRILYDAEQKAQEARFEANAARHELEIAVREKRSQIEMLQQKSTIERVEISQHHHYIETGKSRQNDLRARWFLENEREFEGETVCPRCGRTLPEDRIREAQDLFREEIARKCDEITTEGKAIGDEIAGREKKAAEVEDELRKTLDELQARRAELDRLQAELDAQPEVKASAIVPESIPAYAAKQREVAELEAQTPAGKPTLDTSELRQRKAELNKTRDALSARLAARETIARCDREIARLEEEGRKLAQAIADAEGEEYTAQQLTKARIDECEKRINAMFKFVSFRLFDYTLDGNPVETCIPLVEGVPYGSANTAGKLNAGLDIINTLCRFYGVTAPVFIDGRESVNEIIPTESQIINLVVTNDDKLTIQ